MPISRRPELEKDNPVAPQIYIGPRRRLALARAASTSQAPAQDGVAAALRTLTEAAEQFVTGVPYVQKLDKERNALLDAIMQAQALLSVEEAPARQPSKKGKSR